MVQLALQPKNGQKLSKELGKDLIIQLGQLPLALRSTIGYSLLICVDSKSFDRIWNLMWWSSRILPISWRLLAEDENSKSVSDSLVPLSDVHLARAPNHSPFTPKPV